MADPELAHVGGGAEALVGLRSGPAPGHDLDLGFGSDVLRQVLRRAA